VEEKPFPSQLNLKQENFIKTRANANKKYIVVKFIKNFISSSNRMGIKKSLNCLHISQLSHHLFSFCSAQLQKRRETEIQIQFLKWRTCTEVIVIIKKYDFFLFWSLSKMLSHEFPLQLN
jgi:hypothetical protein